MAKITPESIADLKALFQDNEKALGSNFSQLIDFFNDNKVTDNGDGTYSVGDINLDASKLYNLIISGVTQQQLATKADDSKVVHTSDMRKPASDVAGIEEVNVKADDSKVVHDNKDNTIQVNGAQVDPYNKLTDTIGGRNYALDTGVPRTIGPSNYWQGLFMPKFSENLNGQDLVISFDLMVDAATDGQLIDQTNGTTNPAWFSATAYYNQIQGIKQSGFIQFNTLTPNTPVRFAYKFKMPVWADTTQSGYVTIALGANSIVGGNVTISNPKIEKGTVATDWTPAPEDKVNVSDMRKPASDVAGIEEVNAKADDSKVAHLSGANNFDTVPMVNNNPLLLASSLPSDLARTGQDQEFTGKNTFDVAPIDKTTGNPYITRDGVPAVPSTLADTTKLSNFTAGLQSNGTAVATQSDVTTAISTATANMADVSKTNTFSKQQTFSTNPTNGGSQIWKFTADNSVMGVAVDTSGNVYAGTYEKSVYKINSSGSQVWKFTADNYVWSVAVDSSGNVYVGTSGNSIYKLDSTGSQVWQFTADGSVNSVAVDTSRNIYAGTWKKSVYKLKPVG